MDMQFNQYEGQQNVMLNAQQKKVKKGKICGIVALIIGVLSFTLCCVAGSVLGIAGIVLGIVSLCKEDAKGMAITGIITSVLGLIIGGICAFAMLVLVEVVDIYEEGDYFAGNTYETWDGEAIYFDDELEYEWYADATDPTEGYVEGEFLTFSGELAEEILVECLDSLDMSARDLSDLYDYLGIGSYYTEDNLCMLLMVSDHGIGSTYSQGEDAAIFVGCYDEDMFYGIDMISGEEIVLYMIDSDNY